MINFELYRQILHGSWFIHPSYALTMGALMQQLLPAKQMDGDRDWKNNATVDLTKDPDRAPLPIKAATSSDNIVSVANFSEALQGSVAVIPLKGTMIKYGTYCGYGTEEIAKVMLEAGEAQGIEGIIMDVDSGGGSADSVAPLISAALKVKNEFNKPVIAWGDLCASAAYYFAVYCDRIIAANNLSAHFGSIGVMAQFYDVVPYYEAQGYKFHCIYAPESNYKNLPFEKALKKDYSLMKEEELSPLAVAFQNSVKEQRGNKLKLDTEGLLNGRMFYANNPNDANLSAKSVGLIDDIGNLDYAINLVLSMAETRKFMRNTW